MLNRSFEIKNLWLLARADYASNRRSYLITLAILVLIIGLIYRDAVVNLRHVGFVVDTVTQARFFSESIIILSMLIFATASFNVYYKRKNFPVFSMNIPASRVEKFSYLVIRNIIVAPLSLLIFNFLIYTIISTVYSTETAVYSEMISDENYFIVGALVFCMFSYAFLISILFKKRQLLIAIIIYLVLSVLVAILFFKSEGYSFIMEGMWDKSVVAPVGIVLGIGMFAAAWYKFRCRMQIK